jgi:hypothetical protein
MTGKNRDPKLDDLQPKVQTQEQSEQVKGGFDPVDGKVPKIFRALPNDPPNA